MNGSGFIFSQDIKSLLIEGIAQLMTIIRQVLSWGQEYFFLRIFGALFIFGLFWVIRRIFTIFLLKNIEYFILKHFPKTKKKILAEIEKPIGFLPLILGIYVALEYIVPDMNLAYKAPLFMSLGIFAVFWTMYNLVHPLAYFFNTVAQINSAILDWIVRIIRLTLFLVGLASILETWGIQIAPIIAGLGLFGMAVALGAQDVFKNILAGLAIISEKRFKVDDIISISEKVEGKVEYIGFRSTLIRRFDKSPVYVPNADLADAAVVNYSGRPFRQINWTIGLEYRTSVSQLRYIRNKIEDFILKNPFYSQPPESPIQVHFEGFASSSLSLMVYCFSSNESWEDYIRAKEELFLCIKEVVEESGAQFAFPSQSLYLEQNIKQISSRKRLPKSLFNESEKLQKKNKKKLPDIGII
ncbi:MAG: mechanosensitive ion channel family protein [Alphaproteobacteria bacterium]|nr:mechanosensitive ion channel family protein [Alphaproteobacteria bacterium]